MGTIRIKIGYHQHLISELVAGHYPAFPNKGELKNGDSGQDLLFFPTVEDQLRVQKIAQHQRTRQEQPSEYQSQFHLVLFVGFCGQPQN
jgi:hypothetical protein